MVSGINTTNLPDPSTDLTNSQPITPGGSPGGSLGRLGLTGKAQKLIRNFQEMGGKVSNFVRTHGPWSKLEPPTSRGSTLENHTVEHSPNQTAIKQIQVENGPLFPQNPEPQENPEPQKSTGDSSLVKFEKQLSTQKGIEQEKIDTDKKARAQLKTSVICFWIFLAIGVLAVTVLLPCAIVFFPPLGVGITAGLIVAYIVGGVGTASFFYAKHSDLPFNESDIAKAHENIKIINKCLEYFQKEGFEDFLKNYHAQEVRPDGSYELNVDNIKRYIDTFDSKQKLDNLNKDLDEKKKELDQKLEAIQDAKKDKEIHLSSSNIEDVIDHFKGGVEENKKEIEECTKKIEAIKQKILEKDFALTETQETLTKEIEELTKEIKDRQEEIKEIEKDLQDLETYKNLQAECAKLKEDLGPLTKKTEDARRERDARLEALPKPDPSVKPPPLPSQLDAWLGEPPPLPEAKYTKDKLSSAIRKFDGEYDFLSNNHKRPFHEEGSYSIEGENFASITHYLLIKKYPHLKKEIGAINTAQEALQCVKTQNPELHSFDDLFEGMDKELKTALYAKFVDPEGSISSLGEKLLKTGDKILIAEGEPGNPMSINSDGDMTGSNKLGQYLMDIRMMLQHLRKEEERKRSGSVGSVKLTV